MKWLRLFALFLLPILSMQLGKSDRKAKQEKWAKEEEEAQREKAQEYLIPLTHPLSSITKQNILKKHEDIDYSKRKFQNPMLVYVTPWNPKGYDLAKWVSHKVTHVSPVWLQVKPQTADMSFSCRILGTHDIDHEWMDEVRKNNSEVKIVPRVLFDGWETEQLTVFLSNVQWMNRCLGDILNLLTRTQFDGAVVELWTSAILQTEGEAAQLLVEMLDSWGLGFHKRKLELIVPVGPPLSEDNQLTGVFLPAHFYALSQNVDYIQMMTYDYGSRTALGVSPYEWVEKSIEAILDRSPELANQLMIGINHYGFEYTGRNQKPVNFDKYLENLKDDDSKLEWDPKSKEHFLKTRTGKLYYPSLTSIEMRLNAARKYGVGAAIWEFGQGLNYFTQLL
ncbi:hypothetical protein RB195_021221 [Necator americanus]|uniref:Chitinase domain-containing protein 1 n=1 Tax=Necator americanus TaxID=51031 RepID=A0ABR1E9W3_NECAM